MADRTRDGRVEERTEGQRLLLYKGVLVRVLNLVPSYSGVVIFVTQSSRISNLKLWPT